MSKIQVRKTNIAHYNVIKIMCQDYIQCRCSVNGGKIIDQVIDYQIFKNDPKPRCQRYYPDTKTELEYVQYFYLIQRTANFI